jgi:hypothetical protein
VILEGAQSTPGAGEGGGALQPEMAVAMTRVNTRWIFIVSLSGGYRR